MKMTFDIGFKDSSVEAKITKAQQTKYFFGREVGDHAVLQLELTAEGETYENTLPVMLQEGCDWEFRKDEVRTVTEEDQRIHWGEVLTKFPAYDGDRELTEDAVNAFVAWLRSGAAVTRIIPKTVTEDRNGVKHHNCVIVRPLGETKKEPEVVTPIRAAARKSRAAAPAPRAKTAIKATRDDAWEAYATGKYIVNDPHGERFNDLCDEIIGHDSNDATPEEWGKCVTVFKA